MCTQLMCCFCFPAAAEIKTPPDKKNHDESYIFPVREDKVETREGTRTRGLQRPNVKLCPQRGYVVGLKTVLVTIREGNILRLHNGRSGSCFQAYFSLFSACGLPVTRLSSSFYSFISNTFDFYCGKSVLFSSP